MTRMRMRPVTSMSVKTALTVRDSRMPRRLISAIRTMNTSATNTVGRSTNALR